MTSYLPKPNTILRRWEQDHAADPSLTMEQHAAQMCVPIEAYRARMADARQVRQIMMGQMPISQAGAVTTIGFDATGDFDQWILFQSDNHHDSLYCNRDLETEHLEKALQRNAIIMVFGDLIDGMQGRYDNRRSYNDLRPEYKRDDYYSFIVTDFETFLRPYAKNIALLADGNHDLSILKNANTDVLGTLIRLLNLGGASIQRGGYGGWVRMVFNLGDDEIAVKRIKYFHGAGGEAPVTRGAIQTNRQAVYLPDADIVINGHSHNHYHIPISRERLDEDGRHYFDLQHHIRIPGYKQDYGNGMSGWEVTRGGVPKPVGAVWLHLTRRDDEIVINFESDIRGASIVAGDPHALYNGVVYSQDGEGQ